MNSEERIARRRIGTIEEKIDIIIDFQIANEERFARNEERFAQLAEAQTQTQKRLDTLIERDRNGHSF